MESAGIENKGLDEEFFDVICRGFNQEPFARSLGIELIFLGKGSAGMKMRPQSKYSTEGGRVHGGMIATIADTVMGIAYATMGFRCRTIDINLNYIRPAIEETELIAEGEVIHAGKKIAVVEGSLFNHERKLIAKSRGTFIVDDKYPLYR